MSAALLPESINLARAAWNEATPGTRALVLLRSRYAAFKAINPGEVELMFCSWDGLPPETCHELAWDVQFTRRWLADGHKALKAATAFVGGSVEARG